MSGTAHSLVDAEQFAIRNRPEFAGAMMNAIGKAITDHHVEKQARSDSVAAG